MQPIGRFNLYVSTATVVVMFCFISYLLPFIQLVALPDAIKQYLLPYVTDVELRTGIQFLVTALSTVGTYRIISAALSKLFSDFKFFKRWVFGPSYLEGTWIGRFMDGNDPKFTVEHFEQSLEGVVIRGWAYNEDNSLYADWQSSAASIESRAGCLVYAYTCRLLQSNHTHEGIAQFQFHRPKPSKPPNRLIGYSADLTNGPRGPGARSENREIKLSDDFIDADEASKEARNRFRNLPTAATP